MKKKIIFGTAVAVILVLTAWMLATGFAYETSAYIADFSVSDDGSEMILSVGVGASAGYIRDFKDEGGGVKPHYLKFYSAWGGFNSSLGAKKEYVLHLNPDDTEIYVYRGEGGYSLVLRKDEESGEWKRVSQQNNNNDTSRDENKAPDFTVKLTDGNEFTLSENTGKVVLINFWATWCGPCCREMPAFERLQEEYGDKLIVLAINCGEAAGTVKSFVDKNGYTFPVGIDETAEISTGKYPTDAIPYTVLIDKNGKVVKDFVGAADAEKQFTIYKKAIDGVLND